MTVLPWVVLFAAAGAAWTPGMRPVVLPLLLVGYGLAVAGGLQAAMLAHLGVNLIHFGAFTYPMLAVR